MSWTEVFPVFTDSMVEEYETSATQDERAELEEWYGVEQIFNAQDKPHIASFSLFWKNLCAVDPDLPAPTREIMQQARARGLAIRFDPWDHYVMPLLQHIPRLMDQFPEVVFRVHLARDMEFLIPDFVKAGCEVWWMKSPSIRFAPGGLWRFLPYGEKDKLVTVADTDRMVHVPDDIHRTLAMADAGLGAWRVPVPNDHSAHDTVGYSPFIGCHSGIQGGWPVRQLLDAFTWHCLRGTMPDLAEIPHCPPRPIKGTVWPDYGFDEWFLTAAIYPRVAAAGVLSFVPSSVRSQLLTLDIEYVTWANRDSQLVYFPG